MSKMRSVVYMVTLLMAGNAHAWMVRNPFEIDQPGKLVFHKITDCMHVASEEGLYSFKKTTPDQLSDNPNVGVVHESPDTADDSVCGLYVVADPDKNVEMTIKYLNVKCMDGGLMGFVDGWELNGQYFPSIMDHALPLDKRVTEFCSEGTTKWPFQKGTKMQRRTFRASQNAALLQYRIPTSGSFVVSIRFVANKKPCHIMAEGLAPTYTLRNFGQNNNCTLTALFPAVVSVKDLSVGPATQEMSFNCGGRNTYDRLDIGGSTGLDSATMQTASSACGETSENEIDTTVEQAIFCGTTIVRLSSSGQFTNSATIAIRPADEGDLALMTAVCDA